MRQAGSGGNKQQPVGSENKCRLHSARYAEDHRVERSFMSVEDVVPVLARDPQRIIGIKAITDVIEQAFKFEALAD